MISVYEKEKLRAFLKDFYTLVGIRISVFDNERNKICEYPEEYPKICALVRHSKEGLEACGECDGRAFERAKRMNAAHRYICHAGITETMTPIRLNGNVAGFAIFAHLMPAENLDETIRNICERCSKYDISEEDARAAAKGLKTYTSEEISAAMRILESIAAYLPTSDIVTWEKEELSYAVNRYIEDHISEKITSETLCRTFYVSRTKLYQVSVDAFGTGIGQYIVSKRMEKAKELLSEGDLSMTKVADSIGIPDYNYFCKVFKKQTGRTPSSYRKG